MYCQSYEIIALAMATSGFNQVRTKHEQIPFDIEPLTLCPLGNFSCFFVVCWFFFSLKNVFRNTIRVHNSKDSDQARHFVGLDLGPNCLQRLLADDFRKQRVKDWIWITCSSRCDSIFKMSRGMGFPSMWHVRPAKPQISLRIRTVWSEPLLVAWIFYEC